MKHGLEAACVRWFHISDLPGVPFSNSCLADISESGTEPLSLTDIQINTSIKTSGPTGSLTKHVPGLNFCFCTLDFNGRDGTGSRQRVGRCY